MNPGDPLCFPLELTLALLCGHFLGDFVFQTKQMVSAKQRIPVLLGHAAVVTALSYFLAGQWALWLIPAVLFPTHAAIDYLKVRWGRGGLFAFVVDQLAHLAVIGGIVAVLPLEPGVSPWTEAFGTKWSVALAFVSAAVLVIRVGGMLVGFGVQPYLNEIQHAATVGTPQFRPTRGLTNGGRVIGQWERALIFLFVGLGQPASVGFLVAAKSIFRFGELKDRENRMEAEYITIGTLMSFGWALAVSYPSWWAVRWLMGA